MFCHLSIPKTSKAELLMPVSATLVPEAEGAAGTRHHSDAAKFMKGVTKEIYGTVGEASLEDRVSRRKYYIERGGTDDRNAFRRG